MARRDYKNDYPSVTTILGVLRKIALEYWFKKNTLEFCNRESAKGKLIGNQIHDCIQQYIETGTAKIDTEHDEAVTNALKSFMLFKKERPELKIKLSEIPLASEKYKFNGTIDAPEPPELFDWKTGKADEKDKPTIYDEYKYQVSAYVYLWNENNPENLISKAHIVAVAKDKIAYNIYTMEKQEIDGCFNEVFLPSLRILNYQRKDKSNGL